MFQVSALSSGLILGILQPGFTPYYSGSRTRKVVPFPTALFHLDAPAMAFDDLVGNGQTQAGASRFGGEKRLEDA